MAIMPDKAGGFLSVLACSDSSLQVISDSGKLLIEQKLGSPINCIMAADLAKSGERRLIAYGLQNGNFGLA
jgi:hypothetical protein